MTNLEETVRKNLLLSGVNFLNSFGYHNANQKNILTDEVYSSFFKKLLGEWKDDRSSVPLQFVYILDNLIETINENLPHNKG